MVGAFKVDAVDSAARAVHRVAAVHRHADVHFKDVGDPVPDRDRARTVEKGQEPRSQTVDQLLRRSVRRSGEQERIIAATTVLETALRDMLREELGQTYTVSVGLAQSLPQRGDGHMPVSFGAAPENIQAMTDRVLQEVQRLQQEGPSADLTTRAKESARRGYETALRQNTYWLRPSADHPHARRRPGRILTGASASTR